MVDLFKSLRDVESDLSGAQELLDSGDSELVELAKNEINTNQEKITELEKNIKFMLLPKDKADDGAAADGDAAVVSDDAAAAAFENAGEPAAAF